LEKEIQIIGGQQVIAPFMTFIAIISAIALVLAIITTVRREYDSAVCYTASLAIFAYMLVTVWTVPV
jgi:hypothetical protein